MQRRSSIAIAWEGFYARIADREGKSSRLGQYSRSARGTITLATVSHTPMKWMIGQREEVMRANCAARSNFRPALVAARVREVSISLPRPVTEYCL